MVQLFLSNDPGVRKVADLHLEEESKKQRTKFRPAKLVDELRPVDHVQSRHTLLAAVKTAVSEEEANQLHLHLCQLPAKGEMARAWGETSPQLWAKALQDLPQEVMKFSINASNNSLPSNTNLYLWGKKNSDICSLCHEARQSLPHVLNNS